jgi:hypothetical protein
MCLCERIPEKLDDLYIKNSTWTFSVITPSPPNAKNLENPLSTIFSFASVNLV